LALSVPYWNLSTRLAVLVVVRGIDREQPAVEVQVLEQDIATGIGLGQQRAIRAVEKVAASAVACIGFSETLAETVVGKGRLEGRRLGGGP
jgi:hypothetical protein